MKIIAKTTIGNEFVYSARTAGLVSAKSADKICKIVNEHKSLLGAKENEIYYVYDIDEYSIAYQYAQFRKFVIRNGAVKVIIK